jgi:V/A-type H+/Na+-transporting ATPase subunit I
MDRVAVVGPTESFRGVLVAVADAGVVQLEGARDPGLGAAAQALERVRRSPASADRNSSDPPTLCAHPPDLVVLERDGRMAELAGEAELERVAAGGLQHGSVTALVGWSPVTAVAPLAERLGPLGGAVVRLPRPPGAQPPTQLRSAGATGAFQPLVDAYGTVPYADVNPAALAGLAYVVMFGMMFGDLGHGALLFAGGLLLRTGRPKAVSGLRRLAPFVIGAGAASAAFGLAFGEAFGPTHLVPALWLSPLDRPTTLLASAVAAGASLLAVSYALGTVNRWREGGPARALLATSGMAGASSYVGVAVVGLGWYWHRPAAEVLGALMAAMGLGLGFLGCYVAAGGRPRGVVQAAVESFDALVRIGTNTVSFARLAAFGLTHAALGSIVWSGTVSLGRRGPALWLGAAVVFLVGNALSFALEGLVAGVQALRLEYYELFSRIFVAEGERFRPWHVPIVAVKEVPCSPG